MTTTLDPEVADGFDVVVIGSSPLLLIEALHLASRGERVAVVERKPWLGGAWYTRPLWEFESVEIGCHYIERGRKGYAFLRDALGIELEAHVVEAVWMSTDEIPPRNGARWLPRKLLWGRFLSDDVWGVLKSIDRRDPGKLVRAVRRMVASPPYLYPTGGARAIVEALERRIAESTVALLRGSPAEQVEVGTDGRPHLCRVDGRTYRAARLVVGQHVYPRLRWSEGPAIAGDLKYAVNVLLRIAGEKAVPFEYFEIHRNDLVNRVADVTRYAHPLPPVAERRRELLICCNLTQLHEKGSPVDPTRIFDHLVALGLLVDGARLVDAHVERYPDPETSKTPPPPSVQVLRTYDLGVELERNAERWKALSTR